MTAFDRAEEIAASVDHIHHGPNDPCSIRDRILSLLHEEKRSLALQLQEATRKGELLCCQNGDLLAVLHLVKRTYGGLLDVETDAEIDRALGRAANKTCARPVPMILFCPSCKLQHVDEGEWAAKVHRTHECQGCHTQWRPSHTSTVGVKDLGPKPSSIEIGDGHEICGGCGQEIDPECCGCGDAKKNHGTSILVGHNFIPMGCDCGRDRSTPNKEKKT